LSVWQDVQSGHFKEVALWEVEPEPGFDSEKFYKKECQNCHGRDGSGYLETTPDFSSEDYWKSSPSEVRLLKAILEGVDDQNIPEDERMPAFASKLSPAQAKALLVDKIHWFKPGDRSGD
ncbi:MAG: cytochrome c, partial [Candidatus Omnitrophica bacterium]|nr:cytochrome c [Candidatus Omnitrophota bacterium]